MPNRKSILIEQLDYILLDFNIFKESDEYWIIIIRCLALNRFHYFNCSLVHFILWPNLLKLQTQIVSIA